MCQKKSSRGARERSRRGSVLVVALGLLALLAVFAVSFANIMRLERQASANYLMQTRARMLAEAGERAAVEEIRRAARVRPWSDPRPLPEGDRWLPREGVLDATRGGPHFQGDGVGWGVDVANAANPSLGVASNAVLQDGTPVSRRVSGVLGSTLAGGAGAGDVFVVKVLDCSGQVNLNGGQASLRFMLRNLGEALADRAGVPNPLPLATVDAILALRQTRPRGVFGSKRDLLGALSRDALAVVSDYLTVHGVPEPGVIDPTGFAAGTPATDTLIDYPRAYRIAPATRYAVNVNVASVEVLEACLRGLAGRARREILAGEPGGESLRVVLGASEVLLGTETVPPVTKDQARALADLIVARRLQDPFKTWVDFEAFLANAAVPGLTALQREAIRANADPNARLAGINPPRALVARVEKASLRFETGDPAVGAQGLLPCGTTEFRFGPAGVFEIGSLGRVLDADGRVAGERRMTSIVRALQPLVHTTQRDFRDAAAEATSSGAPSSRVVTGPEPAAVLPSRLDGHVLLDTEFRAPAGADRLEQLFDGSFASLVNPGQVSVEREVASIVEPLPGGADRGDLAPDGVIGWREEPEAMTYAAPVLRDAETSLMLQGRIELWVQVGAERASNEVLFYTKVHDPNRLPPDGARQVDVAGVAWRLERYGNRLVSTRFYFGSPDGARSPVPVIYSGHETNIASWRVGEWHHVRHIWTQGTRQQLILDGQPAGVSIELAGFEPGGGEPGEFGGPAGDLTRHIRLGSNQSAESGHAAGYGFESPQVRTIRTGRQEAFGLNAGSVTRFANAKIDDVRIFSDASNPPVLPRYQSSAVEDLVFRGAFRTGGARSAAGEIGSIAWTVREPDSWAPTPDGSRTVFAQDDIRVEVRVAPDGVPGSLAAVETGGQPLDGRGYRVADAAAPARNAVPASRFLYELRFVNAGGSEARRNVTPVVDDVTLMVILARPVRIESFFE